MEKRAAPITASKVRRLFRKAHPSAGFSDELTALIARAKPISFFDFAAEEIAAGSPSEYTELCETAGRAGLLVVCTREVPSPGLDKYAYYRTYVTTAGESWRIEAFRRLKETFQLAWTFEAEALQSEILGYSKKAISEWIEVKKQSSMGWGGATIVAAMNRQSRGSVLDSSGRLLAGDPHEHGGRYIHVRGLYRLTPYARRRDLTLLRFQVPGSIFPRLFGNEWASKGDILISGRVAPSAEELNSAMVSLVGEFVDGRWTR